LDGVVRFCDVRTATIRGDLPQQGARMPALAFTPDGQTLVTGSIGGIARLWDVGTRLPLSPPLSHPTWVFGAAFHPDGSTVATAWGDGLVGFWGVPRPSEDLPERITCQIQVEYGLELTADGEVRPLDADKLIQRRRRLSELQQPRPEPQR